MLRYALFDYIPQRRLKRASFEIMETDRMILAFKDGRKFATAWAAKQVSKAFCEMNFDNTIFVCCPASCQRTQVRRYRRFSNQLCGSLGMVNGFEHIKVVGKRAKKHIRSNAETKKNNEIHNLLEIDCDFFRGKKVVVFDDICTSGKSSETFVRLLEEAGAIVKLTMFLAKTKTYRR